MNDMITFEKANELSRYDSETGKLFWKKRVDPRIPVSLEAGTLREKDGYINAGIGGKLYPGSYETLLEAVEAGTAADKKYNFHPNHGTNESAHTRNR